MDAPADAQGADHPDALGAAMNLSTTLQNMDRIEEAQALAIETYDGMVRVLGPEHPDTLSMLGNLGGLDLEFARWDSAIDRYSRVVEARIRVLGPDHDQTLIGRRNLAYALEGAGRLEEAEARDPSRPRRGSTKSLGPDAFMTLDTRAQLALVHAAMGRNRGGARELEEVLPGIEKVVGTAHPQVRRPALRPRLHRDRLGERERALDYLERSMRADRSMRQTS